MTSDQPAPSVTGSRDWEWNKLQTTGESGTPTTEAATRPSEYRKENEQLRQRIEILEAELDRRERHIQRIIDQYEQLLAARNRQLKQARAKSERDSDDKPDRDLLADVRQRLDS